MTRSSLVIHLLLGVMLDAAPASALSSVSVDRLERHVRALGADAFEGRAPGTPGGLRAAATWPLR